MASYHTLLTYITAYVKIHAVIYHDAYEGGEKLMDRMMIYMPSEMKDFLKKRAFEDDKTMSKLIRGAIEEKFGIADEEEETEREVGTCEGCEKRRKLEEFELESATGEILNKRLCKKCEQGVVDSENIEILTRLG